MHHLIYGWSIYANKVQLMQLNGTETRNTHDTHEWFIIRGMPQQDLIIQTWNQSFCHAYLIKFENW